MTKKMFYKNLYYKQNKHIQIEQCFQSVTVDLSEIGAFYLKNEQCNPLFSCTEKRKIIATFFFLSSALGFLRHTLETLIFCYETKMFIFFILLYMILCGEIFTKICWHCSVPFRRWLGWPPACTGTQSSWSSHPHSCPPPSRETNTVRVPDHHLADRQVQLGFLSTT